MITYPVISSNINQVGWEEGTLEVHFKRGHIYQYYGVPEEVFENLLKVENVGKYFAVIKDQFRNTLVWSPPN